MSGGSGGRQRSGSEAIVASTSVEFVDVQFVTLEEFGLLYPFFKGVWWRGHGQDHGGDLFVKACQEVDDGCEFILKLRFGGKIFKLINVVLESIIGSSIFIFPRFWKSLDMLRHAFTLVSEGLKFWS